MEDLTERPVASLAPTGQLTDGVSDQVHAMTAPGTDPSQDVSPLRANASAVEVTAEPFTPSNRIDGGDQTGSPAWETVTGRPWGPGGG